MTPPLPAAPLGNTWASVLAIGILTVFVVRYLKSPWRKVPPGPRGLPLLGNVREFADTRWLTSSAVKNMYGDIMHLRVPGQSVVVLNSQRVAADLLDRRAATSSDRPHLILASEIYTGDMVMALLPYGDQWRRMRRASHEGMSAAAVKNYHPIQEKEALILALDMLADGTRWEGHLRRHSASLIMSVLYDKPTTLDASDESVQKINEHAMRMMLVTLPGSNWVQIFPWMKHIPSRFAKWKRTGLEWFAHDSKVFQGLMDHVRAKPYPQPDRGATATQSTGTESPSLGATLIAQQKRSGLSDLENAWLASTLFVAGAETTASSLAWWLVAMLEYPAVQARAQAELDAVVGRERAPTFSDMPALPYVRAMVKELVRWRPVLALGLPHCTTQDEWYAGMFIPKGSICFANLKPCNHDPTVYGADAARFNPARHLDAEGQLKPGPPDTKDEGHVGYGLGRRICIGRHLANDTMFMAIATVLWAMTISRAKDEHGVEIPVDEEAFVDYQLVQRPAPFKLSITPRFPEALGILTEEREAQR
ncbi:cytochrome P450 [Artomyces pyxidatus]|uniref:Cytochrome P450 n=1 Tax=Artomyces pyxidatus TaxID=48021 RepID=A0ACB8SJ78_9AGAM|nr:cytochrome P450 [Artomyces pyxidatus]